MAVHRVQDYLSNEKWTTRVKRAFDTVDVNKNGIVEEADYMRWIENIKRDVNPDAALLDNLTKAMGNFTAALGVTGGKKLNKDEYVNAMAEMAVAENTKRAKGERTLNSYLNEAWHAVVGKNHDGFVTRDEFHTVMKACNVSTRIADARFNAMDKNKNGKIELKELSEADEKFWFDLVKN